MLAGQLWRAFGELRGRGGDFEDRGHQVFESGAGPPEHGHVVRRGPADHLVVCLGGVGGLALENRLAQLLVDALVERDGEDQQRGGEDRPDADFHLLGHDDSPRAESTENIVRSTWCQGVTRLEKPVLLRYNAWPMAIPAKDFVSLLQDVGFDFFTGVPDSTLGGIIATLIERRGYIPAGPGGGGGGAAGPAPYGGQKHRGGVVEHPRSGRLCTTVHI